jgi:hypothetical protein
MVVINAASVHKEESYLGWDAAGRTNAFELVSLKVPQ